MINVNDPKSVSSLDWQIEEAIRNTYLHNNRKFIYNDVVNEITKNVIEGKTVK